MGSPPPSEGYPVLEPYCEPYQSAVAPRLKNENHTKDIDFSPSGIRMRREAGREATMRALKQAPWQGKFDPIEGVILHEAMPDLAMAAE